MKYNRLYNAYAALLLLSVSNGKKQNNKTTFTLTFTALKKRNWRYLLFDRPFGSASPMAPKIISGYLRHLWFLKALGSKFFDVRDPN